MKSIPRLRILPSREDSFRAVANRVPQAEVLVGKVISKSRPVGLWLFGAWRRLATAAVVLLTIWLSLHVMLGANGMVVYRQKRSEYQQLQRENQRLQEQNGLYSQQIKALKSDPQTIEKEAREQLHYTRPGEVIYVAPAQLGPQPSRSSAAQK